MPRAARAIPLARINAVAVVAKRRTADPIRLVLIRLSSVSLRQRRGRPTPPSDGSRSHHRLPPPLRVPRSLGAGIKASTRVLGRSLYVRHSIRDRTGAAHRPDGTSFAGRQKAGGPWAGHPGRMSGAPGANLGGRASGLGNQPRVSVRPARPPRGTSFAMAGPAAYPERVKLAEPALSEVRRMLLPRTPVNRGGMEGCEVPTAVWR